MSILRWRAVFLKNVSAQDLSPIFWEQERYFTDVVRFEGVRTFIWQSIEKDLIYADA